MAHARVCCLHRLTCLTHCFSLRVCAAVCGSVDDRFLSWHVLSMLMMEFGIDVGSWYWWWMLMLMILCPSRHLCCCCYRWWMLAFAWHIRFSADDGTVVEIMLSILKWSLLMCHVNQAGRIWSCCGPWLSWRVEYSSLVLMVTTGGLVLANDDGL